MKMVERRRGGRLGDFGIQTKLAFAFGVLLLLYLINGLMYGASLREVREARAWTDHTREVMLSLDELMPPLLRQQAAMRGYLVTYDPSFLDPFEASGKEFLAKLSRARGLTADNPQQQTTLAELLSLTQQWWGVQEELRVLGSSANKELEIQEVMLSGRGPGLIDKIEAAIKQMSDRELLLLEERDNTLARSLERTDLLSVVMMVGGGLFVLLALFLVSRGIGQPLNLLAGLMTRLAAGEVIGEIPDQRRGDEIGALARGLEKFRFANEELTKREWVKARLAELSIRLQGSDEESVYANTLLAQVVGATRAVSGAVFILQDSGRYALAGGYGVPDENYAARQFAPGEGLVGQVAVDAKPRMVDHLPEDFFRLRSALGQAQPRMLYLLPLAGRENNVLGVIELALFDAVQDREQEFLIAAISMAGLILETLRSDIATRALLRTTQKQGEELRAQEEELRSTNDVLRDKQQLLEEQTQHLRASEEELRAQSEELRVTNAQLEEKSQELNEQKTELERAQAALESKALDLERASQYKSDFLANMSHELRTPLNSLLILAKGLADNEYNNLNDEQLESARIVYDSGKNLLSLINDILDLSKIEAGKMEALFEDFEVRPFIAGIERNFRAVAKERKLDLTIDVVAGVPQRLRGDPGKISQILVNLLSNAFKFTHQGGVTLRVGLSDAGSAAAPELREQSCISFSVSDTGIGIDKDKLDRLFQAFEQGDSGTSRRYGGTGLGLSICRGLARLMGGEVSVTSVHGQGSTFSLMIPLQPNAAPAAAPAPEKALRQAPAVPVPAAESGPVDDGPAAMLIVEDDRQFAEVLAGMARAKGFRVLVANDGESAVRLAARHALTGVLLDIGLPGMDGWEVMECLKENPRSRNVPVHFISGADEDSRARAAGAAGFLRKPVTQQQVAGLLDALPKPGATARRILLVDDSAMERRLVRELLRDENAQIDECSSAEDALERLAQQSYDLIVLDLGLPGMDGFEFLEVASQRGSMPPVVVHSGRELTREESMKLREYTDSVVLKSAPNTRRLLDEVTLFLHSIRRVGGDSEAAARPRPAASATLSGKTVLIVDDDMRNMFALSKALRSHGLKVIMAQDGPKALAQLENSPEIAIVLMDIMMPGMDGYEVMQKVRAQPKWKSLPMIAVTAKAMSGDREKCLAAGANDYCPKPIDVDQLVQQMSVLLG